MSKKELTTIKYEDISYKKVLIKIIIASIIAVILNDVICHIFEYLNVEMKNQDILLNLFNSFPISTTIITLLAPFTEEMIFRYSIRTIIKTINPIVFLLNLIILTPPLSI